MPTLECLDERTKAILAKLEDMDERYGKVHGELWSYLHELRTDIANIKEANARESGKQQGIIWAGGLALGVFSAVCGVVGNFIYTWFTTPHH